MNYEMQIVFNMLVTTLPYRFLSYYPFWNSLRVKKKTAAAIIIISELLLLLLDFFLAKNYAGNASLKFLLESSFSIICFITYTACIRVHFFKLVFFYMLFTEYVMLIRGCGVFLSAHLLSGQGSAFYSWQNSCIQFALFCVAFPFVIWLFRKTGERILAADPLPFWKTLWLIPAFTNVIILLFTGSLNDDLVHNWRFLFTRIFLLACSFCLYYLLLRTLDIIREQAVFAERAKQAEAINDLQKNQYTLLKKRIEETRIARHDLRQHLNLIQAYLDKGDRTALKNYLESYQKSLPADTAELYCNHYAIDIIVRYYAQQAKTNNINFYTKLDLPDTLAVSEPDICVIIGNLLENAVEACQRQKNTNKFIQICGQIIGEKAVSLTIDNSCEEAPKQKGPYYLSTKRDEIGTGLVSVHHIAEKYDGVVNFDYKDGVFYTSVLLNPN